MKPIKTTLDFIKSAVESPQPDQCIDWPYATDHNGYGRVGFDGRRRPAHRVALELHSGPPPSPKHEAAHAPGICHNPGCVNPLHLRWATRFENQADRVLDGTTNRGEKNWSAKLSRTQVLAIYNSTGPHLEAAVKYGVTRQQVGQIRSGKKWAWLTQPEKKAA